MLRERARRVAADAAQVAGLDLREVLRVVDAGLASCQSSEGNVVVSVVALAARLVASAQRSSISTSPGATLRSSGASPSAVAAQRSCGASSSTVTAQQQLLRFDDVSCHVFELLQVLEGLLVDADSVEAAVGGELVERGNIQLGDIIDDPTTELPSGPFCRHRLFVGKFARNAQKAREKREREKSKRAKGTLRAYELKSLRAKELKSPVP